MCAQLKEFLKLGPSADESLDLSCIFDDACPSPLRPHRDVLQKKQSSWKQFLAERSEYSQLSLDLSALDVSGDVSAIDDAAAHHASSLSAAAARPSARARLDRRALKSSPAEFKCRLSDLVAWRVLHPIPAQQLSAPEELAQLMERVLRVHEARGSASVTVRVSLMDGVQREPLVVDVTAEDCAPQLLPLLRPLFNGIDNASQDEERREALVGCLGSCVCDALQLLCFKQQLHGAEIAVRHVRGQFAEQHVLMNWAPPAAAGEGGGKAAQAPLLSAATVTPLSWNARLIALFHEHGVRKVGVSGVQLPEAEWQPSDLREFAYPEGDYYRLHWQQVLQTDPFFRRFPPAGMEPADGQ
jgi:hypothetical protein